MRLFKISHTAGTYFINHKNITLCRKTDEADDEYQEINKESLNLQLAMLVWKNIYHSK